MLAALSKKWGDFMGSHRMLAVLLSCAMAIGGAHSLYAITPVAASDYGLKVTHSELSRIALDSGAQGLELALTITNGGTHDLSDVRLYVIRAGSRAIVDRSEPARVPKLVAGGKAAVTWVFDPKQPVAGPLRDVVIRIEAIDQATRNIVTFSQKSVEVR
jgi:hypothetical protein